MTEEELTEQAVLISVQHEAERLSEEQLQSLLTLGEQLAEAEERALDAQGRATVYEWVSAVESASWWRVSALQEQVAVILPAGSASGDHARLSAVVAAIAGGDALLAWALVARYRSEPCRPETHEQLSSYDKDADRLYEGQRQGGAVSFVSVRETT